jgi:hypothetical protein
VSKVERSGRLGRAFEKAPASLGNECLGRAVVPTSETDIFTDPPVPLILRNHRGTIT